jgi:hypothetical protein
MIYFDQNHHISIIRFLRSFLLASRRLQSSNSIASAPVSTVMRRIAGAVSCAVASLLLVCLSRISERFPTVAAQPQAVSATTVQCKSQEQRAEYGD